MTLPVSLGQARDQGASQRRLVSRVMLFPWQGTPHLTLTSRPWVRASFASSLRSELRVMLALRVMT
jgi:hypothetical protein